MLQWTDDILMESCDINKHFGKFDYLFKNITDLDTYLCPIIRMDNQSLLGVYGGKQHFQYYHFDISMCINDTQNNNYCVDKETMDLKLKEAYLDVLTVDYNIDHTETNDKPYKIYVRSDRHSLSNSIYNRVWMYMETVDYYKDVGIIFENFTLHSFYKVNSFRYDSDLRNINNGGTASGTFANLSILNFNIKQTYRVTCVKLQELCAHVGGIMQLISGLFLIINYIFSESSYQKRIIEYLFEEDQEENATFMGKYFMHTLNQHKNNIHKPKFKKNQTMGLTNSRSQSIIKKATNLSKSPEINSNNSIQTPIYNNLLEKKKKYKYRNSQNNFIQNENIKRYVNIFDSTMAKIMFNKKIQDIYFTKYFFLKKELDIKYYLKMKNKFKELDAFFEKLKKKEKLAMLPSYKKKSFKIQNSSNILSVTNNEKTEDCLGYSGYEQNMIKESCFLFKGNS